MYEREKMLLSDRHAVVGIIPSEMTKSCPGNFAPEEDDDEDAQEVNEDYWDKKTGTKGGFLYKKLVRLIFTLIGEIHRLGNYPMLPKEFLKKIHGLKHLSERNS